MSNDEKNTFSLTISGKENQELQGVLRTPDGETLVFRSSIELLTELNAQTAAEAGQQSAAELTT